MNIVQKYLLRRKDTYYFRLKVPKRLRLQIECREIKKSLGTLDLNKAEVLSTLLLRKFNKTVFAWRNQKCLIEKSFGNTSQK